MERRVNDRQLGILRWIADGCPPREQPAESYKVSALALANRKLVQVSKRKGRWLATLTEAGRHFLDTGEYPPRHFLAKKPEPSRAGVSDQAPVTVAASGGRPGDRDQRERSGPGGIQDVKEVDSPARVRRKGYRPRGDGLHGDLGDPWDERVLVSVKEAAWLLSLPEHAIRQAVTSGDVERVFIGMGNKNYRVVYGSLLAWVNSMPRDATNRWWD